MNLPFPHAYGDFSPQAWGIRPTSMGEKFPTLIKTWGISYRKNRGEYSILNQLDRDTLFFNTQP